MSDIEVEVFIFNNVTIIVYIIGSIEVEMYWYWHWSYGRYPRGVWSGHHRASYRFPASRDGIVDPSTEKQNETICFLFHVPRCSLAIFTCVTISFELYCELNILLIRLWICWTKLDAISVHGSNWILVINLGHASLTRFA